MSIQIEISNHKNFMGRVLVDPNWGYRFITLPYLIYWMDDFVMNLNASILVSVVVPVYHDWERLQKCLDALSSQTFAKDNYEIIIVNNDPYDTPPDNLHFPTNCKIINQAKPGSYAARNSGVKSSQGYILAFTDSDCLPHPDWIKYGVVGILNGEASRVAGQVKIFSKTKKMTAVECYESIFAFNQKRNVSRGVSVTANLFVRADLFKDVGLFNDSIYSGGDTEWNFRSTKMGYSIKYVDESVVNHPARRTWPEMASKIRRTTGGKLSLNPKYRLNIFRSFFPPLEAFFQIVYQKGPSIRTKVLALAVAYKIKIFRYLYFRKLRSNPALLERA